MDKFSFTFKSSAAGTTFAALALFLTQVACLPRGSDLADEYAAPPPTFAQVDFSTLKTTVLQPYCIGCHGDFQNESGLLPFMTAGDPDHSPLYTDVESGAMPPGGPQLSANAVDIIRTYILDAANSEDTRKGK